MKRIIVALDKKRGIGAKNDLLWMRDLPADLRHFKECTTGATIIMGRNTFDSIGRALPKRQNIVVSRGSVAAEDVTAVNSITAAYKAAQYEDIWIIGGGQLYAQAIDDMDQLYVTEVDATFDADVFFPEIDLKKWHEISREHHVADEHNKYNFDFVVYSRRLLVP